jgi:hypothetical protein
MASLLALPLLRMPLRYGVLPCAIRLSIILYFVFSVQESSSGRERFIRQYNELLSDFSE